MPDTDKFFTDAVNVIKSEFKIHSKRIIRANRTQNYKKRTQYMREAIASYNKFILEVGKHFSRLGYDDKTSAREYFLEFKGNILKYLGSYNLNNFPELKDGYHEINIELSELEALVCTGSAIRPISPTTSRIRIIAE